MNIYSGKFDTLFFVGFLPFIKNLNVTFGYLEYFLMFFGLEMIQIKSKSIAVTETAGTVFTNDLMQTKLRFLNF